MNFSLIPSNDENNNTDKTKLNIKNICFMIYASIV